MSNIQAAITQAGLMMPASVYPDVPNPKRPRSRMQVAKRVFQLAASGGFPYTGMTYKQWGKKWLSSDSFRLMEIDINAAASPHLPKNPERVAFRVLCAQDSMDPIVVDLNRQKVGKSHLGFIPEVIVVDGKHRKKGQELQGHTRILAWVGCKAEKKLKNATVIDEVNFKRVLAIQAVAQPGAKPAIEAVHFSRHEHKELKFKPTPMDTAVNLHCAVTPSSGQMILDQSGGERGSRPRDAFVKAKKQNKMKSMGSGTSGAGGASSLGGGSGSNPQRMGLNASARILDDCEACSPAFSEGQIEEPSSTDATDQIPDASDQASRVSASDRLGYDFPKPNVKAPGAKGWNGFISSPAKQSPGSGVGPRTNRSTGASRSEMSRAADSVPTIQSARTRLEKHMESKAKLIDKIYVKDKSKRHLFANLNKGK